MKKCCDKLFLMWYLTLANATVMREWLSGRASPCQGESRGFDPRSRSLLFQATSPSGKARLCKSCTSGSNPLVASQRYVIK